MTIHCLSHGPSLGPCKSCSETAEVGRRLVHSQPATKWTERYLIAAWLRENCLGEAADAVIRGEHER